jgi:hypothetical protein
MNRLSKRIKLAVIVALAIGMFVAPTMAASFDNAVARWRFADLNDSNGANSALSYFTYGPAHPHAWSENNAETIPGAGSNNLHGRVELPIDGNYEYDTFRAGTGAGGELKFPGDATIWSRVRFPSKQEGKGSASFGFYAAPNGDTWAGGMRTLQNGDLEEGIHSDPAKSGASAQSLEVPFDIEVGGDTPDFNVKWYDLSVVNDTTAGRWTLYVYDTEAGTLIGSDTATGYGGGANGVGMLESLNYIDLAANSWGGIIDIESAAVWNQALSADQIDALTNGTIPEPASVALLGLGGLIMVGRRRIA